jgi:hypothetical protein
MALEITTDLILGIAALAVAAVAIYMFTRATGGTGGNQRREPEPEPLKVDVDRSSRVKVPELERIAKRDQVSEARSKIRTLALRQEIITMVMKRLFEAEDNGEISREERERLGKDYEAEMNQVTDELNRAELIVSLSELEEIRTDLIKQFQETLADTQSKIDMIIGELHIESPKPPEPEPEEKPTPTPRRAPRRRPRPQTEEEPEEEEEEEEEETRGRDTVEDRLNKLKEDVLKELEELDRLELEA